MPEDDVSIRLRLRDALRFEHDANRAARAVDNIGDQASQTARRLRQMSLASSKSRLNIGPFSTSMRGGALAVGAFALTTRKAVPTILSAAKAVATLAGGAGAAGGVGLLALGQAAGVAKLGLGGLTDALGGNETAAKKLNPEIRDLFDMLSDKKSQLQSTAQNAMLPGLEKGAKRASKNFGVLKGIVRDTGKTVGGLGADAGGMLGSAGFGRDLKTVGRGNVRIIDNLGHAGLFLADSLRHVIVEAEPLAVWLSGQARDGARSVDIWAKQARASGEMAHFFREARVDLKLLGSIGGHSGTGLINLFGSQDVNGTKTLQSLDQLTARFERWTRSPAVQRNVGDAVLAEIPKATSAILDTIVSHIPEAAGRAATVFVDTFQNSSAWGKLLLGGWLAKKLGIGGLAGGLAKDFAGKTGGPLGLLASRGSSIGNPLYVAVVNDLPGGGKGGGIVRNVAKTGAKIGAGAGATIGPLAAGGGAAAAILGPLIALGRHQHGPADPIGDRNAAQRAARQLGFPARHQNFDAQGFPTNAPARPQNIDISLEVEGRKLAEIHARAVAAQSARR